MYDTRPSTRTWLLAIAYGLGAYSVHKTGVILGWYYSLFWFQLLTHFLSATALVILLLVAGRTLGLTGTRLLVFVLGGWAVGALTWELVEYLDLVPWLIWWGIEDSLIDLASDTVGLLVVLAAYRARRRGIGASTPSSTTVHSGSD